MLQRVRCVTSDVFSSVLCLFFFVICHYCAISLLEACSLQFVPWQKDFALPNVSFQIVSFRECFLPSWFETELCNKMLFQNLFQSSEACIWMFSSGTGLLVESLCWWSQVSTSDLGIKIILCGECEEKGSLCRIELNLHFFALFYRRPFHLTKAANSLS